MLYLIEILHQTTTAGIAQPATFELYLIEILHQTTTKRSRTRDRGRCILSKFYIKPQRLCRCSSWPSGCILSKFYIKPQRVAGEGYSQAVVSYRNSTSNHNRRGRQYTKHSVVSYRNSTSNHNFVGSVRIFVVLYLIEILHQTTTGVLTSLCDLKLYLIEILHQTTTFPLIVCTTMRCILSKFYIKPQPFRRSR